MLENRSRDYVEARIRAGVIEQGAAEILVEAGIGERMGEEGIVHHGIHVQFDGERHHLPLSDLAGGRHIVIYGQTEVVKDLIAAANGSALVALADEDVAKCNNCKTCYQDLPELFEKTRIVVDGATKEVGHLIPGALARVKPTPELRAKAARNDAERDRGTRT